MVFRATVMAWGVIALAGCFGPGLLSDGSSVSVGSEINGALRDGERLPLFGDGYHVPDRWKLRRRQYGTEEMVGLIVRAARRVRRRYPEASLGVADISARGGGPVNAHYTHASGRDVDLLYFATDLSGRPVTMQTMVPFKRTCQHWSMAGMGGFAGEAFKVRLLQQDELPHFGADLLLMIPV